MSDIIAEGIIEKRRLEAWANTFHSGSVGNNSSPLTHEVRVHFNSEDGVTVRCVDAANVAMINPATLAPRGFEAYDCPGTVTIGISLDRFLDALDPAGPDQLVEFGVDMESRHLNLRYGNTDLSLALIDPDSMRNEPNLPDHDLPNTVTVEGSVLKHAVTIGEMMDDHVWIEGHPDEREVTFSAVGDIDDGSVTLSDEDVIDSRVDEQAESGFSVDYLGALAKPIPDDSEVTLTFGQEFPIHIDWASMDGAFEVHQMLAPRIKNR